MSLHTFTLLMTIRNALWTMRLIYSRKFFPHSVSIIKHTDACDCIIQSVEIQLIGGHSNCTSNGNFIIYHTFNFVTECLHNNKVMPYYRENEHILQFPSSASILHLPVTSANTTGVYTEDKVPIISIQQL